MTNRAQNPAPETAPRGGTPTKQPKPLRFTIGVGLLTLYPILLLIIPIGPFLPIPAGFRVGLIAGVVAAAEGIFLLGIARVGKEAYQAIKAKLGLGGKKRTGAAATPAAVETEPPNTDETVDRDRADKVERTRGVDTTAVVAGPRTRRSEDGHDR